MLLESGTFLQKKVKIGNFLRKSMSLDERTGLKKKTIFDKTNTVHYYHTDVGFAALCTW